MEKRVVISRLTPRPTWPPNLGGVTVTESISVRSRSIFFPDTVQLLSLSSPILFSLLPFLPPKMHSSLPPSFYPLPEKNGRWTTRRCPESLNFFKISSRFYGYSCLEEDFWQDFLLGGREKKGGLGGKRDVTKTIPTSCSVVQSYCRNNVRPI